MNLLQRLFNNNKKQVECPRCLGKGLVSWEDIKRLNQELKWIPGTCAYCNGTGNVDAAMVSVLPVDMSYLTTDLPLEEREKLLANDPAAMQRAQTWDVRVTNFINQTTLMYFQDNLEPEAIVDYYLQWEPNADPRRKAELLDYIRRVIEQKKNKS